MFLCIMLTIAKRKKHNFKVKRAYKILPLSQVKRVMKLHASFPIKFVIQHVMNCGCKDYNMCIPSGYKRMAIFSFSSYLSQFPHSMSAELQGHL